MIRHDVEGCANTFKLSEGTPEQLDDECSVIEEQFLPPASSPSPASSDGGFRRRRPPFVPASTVAGSSTPSPRSLGDRRFVVVDREEEEVKKMISLWKKQGKAGEGEGVILTRCRTVRCLCPHRLLHYC
jgi:hypothetical protein